ncbi:ribonuclease E inhibitor RraB [Pseudaestuariivita rosea]|uniref:ribonuclease E inhibitor RraB n=1 Tax=Pseudaestuariivita rosea TaxID=2763263 RepID=UPI001ABAC8ED|nr:ribonuclease E inhibitor RraB [Pseudaestuariivita rosea]
MTSIIQRMFQRLRNGEVISDVSSPKPLTASFAGSVAANDAVRQVLRTHGDDGEAPRHTIHYAYAMGRLGTEKKAEVRAYLENLGFSVADATTEEGFVLDTTGTVAGDDFDRLTTKLQKELEAMHWDYDGWECAVESAKGMDE